MNRAKLVSALDRLTPSDKPGLIEQTSYYWFKDDLIIACDGLCFSRVKLDETPGLNCLVPVEIYPLLKSLTEDDVTLTVKDETLRVATKKLKGKFSIKSELGVLKTLDFEAPAWKPCPAGMLDGLNLCRTTTSQGLGGTPGVKIEGKTLLAVDGTRLSLYTCKDEMDAIIVPAPLIKVLAQWPDLTEWAVRDGIILFRNAAGAVVGARAATEAFPDVTGLLNTAKGMDITLVFPENMADVLARHAAVMKDIDGANQSMCISVANKVLSVKTEGYNKTLEEEVGTVDKGAFSILINPTFLKDVLKYTRELHWAKDNHFVAFHADMPNGTFDHMVALKHEV